MLCGGQAELNDLSVCVYFWGLASWPFPEGVQLGLEEAFGEDSCRTKVWLQPLLQCAPGSAKLLRALAPMDLRKVHLSWEQVSSFCRGSGMFWTKPLQVARPWEALAFAIRLRVHGLLLTNWAQETNFGNTACLLVYLLLRTPLTASTMTVTTLPEPLSKPERQKDFYYQFHFQVNLRLTSLHFRWSCGEPGGRKTRPDAPLLTRTLSSMLGLHWDKGENETLHHKLGSGFQCKTPSGSKSR